MSIDRHNYEEFFILYMDNELSSDQRKEVELFVQVNADLKEEFDMLQQSKLVLDDAVVFGDKELLLKPAGHIDITNYEEWLLLYTDNELDAEQKIMVEKFAAANPSVSEELSILQKSRLQPEAIIFPNKESLYRKEETSRRVVMMRWTRIAVAAVLLFAVSIGGFLFINRNDNGSDSTLKGGIAQGTEKKNTKSSDGVPKVSNQSGQVTTTEIEQTDIKREQNTGKEETQPRQIDSNPTFVVKSANPSHNKLVEQPNEVGQQPAETDVYKPRNIQGSIEQIGFTNPEPTYASSPLTVRQQNKPVIVVTPKGRDTFNSQQPDDDIAYANASERKNSRLRGFFRKVTRTIEKTTNIKTTDDDDRLLVAGLAIRL